MNTENFKKEYESFWIPNELYKSAYKIWVWYYYTCEKYDRKVCSRTNDNGEAIPISADERSLINFNAQIQMQYALNYKKNEEIDNVTWLSAKSEASRLTWNGLEMEYKRLFS